MLTNHLHCCITAVCFIGNFKEMYGVPRELQPFVFTPEMAMVISEDMSEVSEEYARFEGMCCRAYNKLRSKGNLLITLFALMLPAALSEVKGRDDIGYLRDMLSLNISSELANEKFRNELKVCLKESFSRALDNQAHIFKHKA